MHRSAHVQSGGAGVKRRRLVHLVQQVVTGHVQQLLQGNRKGMSATAGSSSNHSGLCTTTRHTGRASSVGNGAQVEDL